MSLPTLPGVAGEPVSPDDDSTGGLPQARLPPHEVSRRSLLRSAGVAGATVAVLATGVLSYRVFDTAVLDPDHGGAFDPWRNWRTIKGPLGTVAAAILAANPHNSQPWIFHVTGSAVDLYADPSRVLGTIDLFKREHHLGLGCALENLAIAASAQGATPNITLLPSGPNSNDNFIAHIELVAAVPQAQPLYETIGNRHSNRGPYRATGVTAAVLADLVDTTGLPGVNVHWIADTGGKAALGTLMLDAATAIIHDEQQSVDGFAWFRSDDDAIQQHRDGLTLDEQGLSPVLLTLGKLLPASSRTAGDAFWVKQTREVHTKTAAAYGVITVADSSDVSAQLNGGRLLQRVHLTASNRGVAFQHMNQITERIDREKASGAAATFAPRFAELLPAGVQPLSAFRVGYAVRSSRRSPRRPLSAVTR